jgi:dephospho-CoA kinase
VTRVIGVTGNIASGKSTVAALFAAKGATVIDADELARDALGPGSRALAAVAARWPGSIGPGGALDRVVLRNIVFQDAGARAALNAIVHPEVERRRDALVAAARAKGVPIVVYDAPLLFEAGLDHEVDEIVLVDAPEPVRRERLVRERALSAADASAMIAAQMPSELKRPRAHHIIDNTAGRDALAARVDAVWNALARHPASG